MNLHIIGRGPSSVDGSSRGCALMERIAELLTFAVVKGQSLLRVVENHTTVKHMP